jgi:hypothetical protein
MDRPAAATAQNVSTVKQHSNATIYLSRRQSAYRKQRANCSPLNATLKLTDTLLNFGAFGYVWKTKNLLPFLALAFALPSTAWKRKNSKNFVTNY